MDVPALLNSIAIILLAIGQVFTAQTIRNHTKYHGG